jgi:hypothetical protein
MRYLGLGGAFALSVAVALLAGPAKADDGDCADFRNKILAADARGEIFLGYYKLRNQLGRLYATFCPLDPPVRLTDAQYAKVCGGPVPDDPDQRADMLQLCAVQGAYPDQASPSDLPDMTVPTKILPNGMSAASAWAGQIAKDPGYQRMCREAAANENTCRQRQANMRTCEPNPTDPTKCAAGGSLGTAGQAGAFNDCALLYQGVLGMCHAVARSAAAPPAAPKSPQAAKAAPPPAKADPNAPQASSAPPAKPEPATMSQKCQQLVSNYIAASQANDGPKALAGYNALKQAGGCNVLAQVDKPMPATSAPSVDDPRFAARGDSHHSDGTIGACDASPDVCAARVQQLRAGVSPEAVSALWMHAINVGLELSGAMANAATAGVPRSSTVRGPSTDMNSIGNHPVRSTYGQGSPTHVAPAQGPSDITGTH